MEPEIKPLPSTIIVEVPRRLSFAALAALVSDQQLVCLVEGHRGLVSQADTYEHVRRNAEVTGDPNLCAFLEDPRLVVMRFGDTHIVVRASFMRATAHAVNANTFADLANAILREAQSRGLRTTSVRQGGGSFLRDLWDSALFRSLCGALIAWGGISIFQRRHSLWGWLVIVPGGFILIPALNDLWDELRRKISPSLRNRR